MAMDPNLQSRLFSPAQLEHLEGLVNFTSVAPILHWSDIDDAQLARLEYVITGWLAPTIDREILYRMPRLRAIIHTAGSVKGHIKEEVWDLGIPVTSAAESNSIPVAEYTIAMVLLAGKGVPWITRAYAKSPATLRISSWPLIGNYRRRVGIIGASRIGRRVLAGLSSHDLELYVADPFLTETTAIALGARLVSLDELMATCSIVTIHAPDTSQTKGLVGARELAFLSDDSTVINTARPALIDDSALLAEVQSGRLSAILDVTQPDRLPPEHPYWLLPNVLLTPHIAGSQGTELQRLGDSAIRDLEHLLAGELPDSVVSMESLNFIA